MFRLHHELAPLFALANGQAQRLHLHDTHCLQVRSGRLWLTLDGRVGAPAEDVVLQPGETMTLPKSRGVVLEALPTPEGGAARFDLLLCP